MAVVIDFDPARRFGQFEQVSHFLQQFTLRSALRQLAVQRLFGVTRRLFDQAHTVAALRHADFDLAFSAFGQGLRQQVRLGQLSVKENGFRRGNILIKLREKACEHLVLADFSNMRGKEGTMPPILPTTNEKCLNAHHAVAMCQRENVSVAHALRVDRLRPLNKGKRPKPVADHGGAFKIQRLGGGFHFLGQFGLHSGGFAGEEGFGVRDKTVIGRVVNPPDTRRGTALDLIQQARPVTIVKKTVSTASQQKQFLQRVQRLVDGASAGERAVILTLMPPRTAMFLNTRKFMVGAQQDEGKAFIVAQQHIVSGAVTLDELRLQQQRLSLAIGGDDGHRSRQRDHPAQAVGQPVNLHIIADAIL